MNMSRVWHTRLEAIDTFAVFLYLLSIDVKQNSKSVVNGAFCIVFILVLCCIHFSFLHNLAYYISRVPPLKIVFARQAFVKQLHIFSDFIIADLCIDSGGSPIGMSKQFTNRFEWNTL